MLPTDLELALTNPDVQLTTEVPVREVRLAVSMVGGSALCMYENGVAQELFRLVHGVGVYGVLKRLTQSHAFIDIFSGTSAGGINTILLSAALTSNSDFRLTKDAWIELGDIDGLLQQPRDDNAKAILQGETFYAPKLEEVFQKLTQPNTLKWKEPTLPSGRDAKSPAQPDVKQYRNLDLFVTGTYYDGRLQTFFDARNQPIYGRDHAGVFHLKHRPRRSESHFLTSMGEPFTGGQKAEDETKRKTRYLDVPNRLARIARTTSSLPAVFEPSLVKNSLMQDVIPLPAPQNTPNAAAAHDPGAYILDGGFLNNRPLDLVLKEIYFREADAEVLRKVLLVEPDPERARRETNATQPPNALESLLFWQTVSDYQSLSNFLRSVEDHNRRVQRINETLDTARNHFRQGDSLAVNRTQIKIWASLSAQAMRDEIITIWENRLGLNEFTGLLSGDQTEIEKRREELMQKAVVLRYVRSELLEHINKFFEEGTDKQIEQEEKEIEAQKRRIEAENKKRAEEGAVLAQAKEVQASAEQDSQQPSSMGYELESVDITALLRRIMRAQSEIYQTLYPPSPRVQVAAPSTNQPTRQQICDLLSPANKSPQSPSYKVQRYLNELAHLIDLAQIVSECMGVMIGQLVASPLYKNIADSLKPKQVNEDDAQKHTKAFWKLIENALRLLLEDEREDWKKVKAATNGLDELQKKYNAEAENLGKRHAEKLPPTAKPQTFKEFLNGLKDDPTTRKQFYELSLPVRCEIICKAIVGGEDEHGNPIPPEVIGANCKLLIDHPWLKQKDTTIQGLLNERLNEILRLAAEELEPIFAPPKQPKQTTGTKNLQDLPLRWAYDWPNGPQGIPGKVGSTIEIGRRLRALDTYTFPVQRASGLESLSLVELVHLTPRGAQADYSRRESEDKLAGDELGHLSGFLKASWRANDIMWGRLDGVVTLVDTLLDPERLQRLIKADSTIVNKLIQVLKAYLQYGALIPNSKDGSDQIGDYLHSKFHELEYEKSIREWLNAAGASEKLPASTKGFELLKSLIVQRAQLEILQEDMPEVLAQGLAESARWRQGEFMEEVPKKSPKRVGINEQNINGGFLRRFSPTLAKEPSNAGMVLADARAWVKSLFRANDKPVINIPQISSYFVNQYHVGSETVEKNIPPVVTLRRASALLLVVFNVLNGCFKNDKNALFGLLSRFIFKPLRFICTLLYGFTLALENGARVLIAITSALWAVLIISILAFTFNLTSNTALLGTAFLSSLGLLLLLDVLYYGRRKTGVYLLLSGASLMVASAVFAKYFLPLPTPSNSLAKQVALSITPEVLKKLGTYAILWWGGAGLLCAGLFFLATYTWRKSMQHKVLKQALVLWSLLLLASWGMTCLWSQYAKFLAGFDSPLDAFVKSQRLPLAVGAIGVLVGAVLALFLNQRSSQFQGPRTKGGLNALGLSTTVDEWIPYFYSWGQEQREQAKSILKIDYFCAVGYLGLGAVALFYTHYFDSGFWPWLMPPLLLAALAAPVLIILDWLENNGLRKMIDLGQTIENRVSPPPPHKPQSPGQAKPSEAIQNTSEDIASRPTIKGLLEQWDSETKPVQPTSQENTKLLKAEDETPSLGAEGRTMEKMPPNVQQQPATTIAQEAIVLRNQRFYARIASWRWTLLFVVGLIVLFSVAVRGFDYFIIGPTRQKATTVESTSTSGEPTGNPVTHAP